MPQKDPRRGLVLLQYSPVRCRLTRVGCCDTRPAALPAGPLPAPGDDMTAAKGETSTQTPAVRRTANKIVAAARARWLGLKGIATVKAS